MVIYVSHSSAFDFKNELYAPLKNSIIGKGNKLILPHDRLKNTNSKDLIKSADLVLAEVSYPSTGSGIEIGWANDAKVPIICIHLEGSVISSSLNQLAKAVIHYKTNDELINKLNGYLNQVPT